MTNLDDLTYLYEIQPLLFEKKVSRHALLDVALPTKFNFVCNINVWRNHSFESLVPLISPYSMYGKWQANFYLSDYDDTMMFVDWKPSDIELIWMDISRYLESSDFSGWLDWIKNRIASLRKLSQAPIILATWLPEDAPVEWLQNIVDQFPSVYFADLKSACEQAKVNLIDQRTAKLAGTLVSNSAQLVLAREFACHWLPSLLFPQIKAIALDLDNTLYRGILGEDGVYGVEITSGHASLQRFIKKLQQQGIFVALVSRNEWSDVEELFAKRQDFHIGWEDFSVKKISWDDKANALEEIANDLRISTEAILFVDDNLGELSSVVAKLSKIHSVFAHQDASLTTRVIKYYPGIWRWNIGSDDVIRINDLKANTERDALLDSSMDLAEYFSSLQVTLTYANNPIEQISRLSELCNKTNQFNMVLSRYGQAELAGFMESDNVCVTSVRLTDRLTDSGTIAVIIAKRQDDQLEVIELCISCRAMGRKLEDTIVLHALREMSIFARCKKIVFHVRHGPRNQPALNWLAGLLNVSKMPVEGEHILSAVKLLANVVADGVKVINE